MVSGYPEVGVGFMLWEWKEVSLWDKKHTAMCHMGYELYTGGREIAFMPRFERSRSWFSQSNQGVAGCGFVYASFSITADLRDPCYHL